MIFKNYFLVALRRFRSEKLLTSINILSLSLGLASCLIIILFVKNELSYDQHHKQSDQIVRVTREWKDENGQSSLHLATVAAPIGPLLEEQLPEVDKAVRFFGFDLPLKRKDEFISEPIFFTEPSVSEIFTFHWLQGNGEGALVDPNTVIISESMSEKYFPLQEAVGKVLTDDDGTQFKVTAVFRDFPSTSHIDLDILISFSTLNNYWDEEVFQQWGNNNFGTYLLLKDTEDTQHLDSKLEAFMMRNAPSNVSASELHLQTLPDIHLNSHLTAEYKANGNFQTVLILSFVAFVILLLACFNFISLSTATSLERAKEVGIRKVFGANKKQLVGQFLGEAVLTAFISLLAGTLLSYVALPYINELIGRQLSLFENDFLRNFFILLGILFFTGIVAGSYPALVLSGFKPVSVLRGRGKSRKMGKPQKSVVIVQFTFSVALIIFILSLNKQLEFAKNKDLGFSKAQVVVLPYNNEIGEDFDQIKSELESWSGVLSVTASKFVPSDPLLDNIYLDYEKDGNMGYMSAANISVGHDYFETYGVKLLAGRDFVYGSATDSSEALIVNESFVKTAGYANNEAAIDKKIVLDPDDDALQYRIVGVVNDFHFESIHKEIAPNVFFVMPQRYRRVSVKLTSSNTPELIDQLKGKWQPYLGNVPFSFSYIDQNLRELYLDDAIILELILYLSIFAVVIACFGLLGIAIHHANQKRKEISVRKVVGASEFSVSMLMIKNFLILVVIALLIGIPIGYYVTDKWLETFAYRIEVDYIIITKASTLILLFALATVAYESIKVALLNPTHVLRNE